MSKSLMNGLDAKSSKTTIDPLINRKCRLRFNYMPTMRSVGIGFVSFFAFTALGVAAADFKIRYNQKFPCLEVMDSSATGSNRPRAVTGRGALAIAGVLIAGLGLLEETTL